MVYQVRSSYFCVSFFCLRQNGTCREKPDLKGFSRVKSHFVQADVAGEQNGACQLVCPRSLIRGLQRLSFPVNYNINLIHANFNIQLTCRLRNHEDRFSRVEAQVTRKGTVFASVQQNELCVQQILT